MFKSIFHQNNRFHMNKKMIQVASLFAILAVALGAFGAHGLKKSIEINQLATFEVGVRYQLYHFFIHMESIILIKY